MPEWVLSRPSEPLPDWRGSDLVVLGGQLAHVAAHWVADLTVMATGRVATVEVRYAGDILRIAVQASGLVTVPGVVRSVSNVAEFRGFNETGELVAVERYPPLTDCDRRSGWPDASLWEG
jgi:hypothetical protein